MLTSTFHSATRPLFHALHGTARQPCGPECMHTDSCSMHIMCHRRVRAYVPTPCAQLHPSADRLDAAVGCEKPIECSELLKEPEVVLETKDRYKKFAQAKWNRNLDCYAMCALPCAQKMHTWSPRVLYTSGALHLLHCTFLVPTC